MTRPKRHRRAVERTRQTRDAELRAQRWERNAAAWEARAIDQSAYAAWAFKAMLHAQAEAKSAHAMRLQALADA